MEHFVTNTKYELIVLEVGDMIISALYHVGGEKHGTFSCENNQYFYYKF